MKLLGKASLAALAVLGTVALTPACADNDSTIFIRHALAPPTNRVNGRCIYTPDPTQPFISSGVLDVAVRDTYNLHLLVGAQLQARADSTLGRAEVNRTHVNGAVVRVTDVAGGQINEFTALASAFIDVGLNGLATNGIVDADVIDQATTRLLNVTAGNERRVIVNVKVFGKTLGNVDVESGEFQFPIDVCSGCLISFDTGDDPAVPGTDCNRGIDTSTSAPTTNTGNTVVPCAAGQDEVTPCQLCKDVSPACQGR